MTPEQRQEADSTTDTCTRHSLMYRISANNPDKGKPGGDCNVTQCQRPGASSYNSAMNAFYCKHCAVDINRFNDNPFVEVLPDYSLDLGNDPENRPLSLPTDKLDSSGNFIRGPEPPVSKKKFRYKVGRNDLCPCGSNIKYKKCCLQF